MSCPEASFVFLPTNKVYGDLPNCLPPEDRPTRLELPEECPWFGGIGTDMSIDSSTHSLFGVSKAAEDLAVQEYVWIANGWDSAKYVEQPVRRWAIQFGHRQTGEDRQAPPVTGQT